MAWLLLAPAPCRADELDEQRTLFEQGMSAFREGLVAEALGYWEPILSKLGDARGYRLLYNVGVGRELLGDATAAADHYERFLAQVAARPAAQVPAEVQEFARDAGARLGALKAKYGRIRLRSERGAPLEARVDQGTRLLSGQTLYVVPDSHAVALRPGSPGEEQLSVAVAAGQLAEVTLPAPAAPAPRPPFSAVWIGVAAATTAGSLALPLLLRADSLDIKRVYDTTPSRAQAQELYDEYARSRTRYQLSWLLPGALALGTGALAAVYLRAPREAAPAPEPRATVQVAVGPSAGLVTVGGVWP